MEEKKPKMQAEILEERPEKKRVKTWKIFAWVGGVLAVLVIVPVAGPQYFPDFGM